MIITATPYEKATRPLESTAILAIDGMLVVDVTAMPMGLVVATVLAGLMKLRMIPKASITRMVAEAETNSRRVVRW